MVGLPTENGSFPITFLFSERMDCFRSRTKDSAKRSRLHISFLPFLVSFNLSTSSFVLDLGVKLRDPGCDDVQSVSIVVSISAFEEWGFFFNSSARSLYSFLYSFVTSKECCILHRRFVPSSYVLSFSRKHWKYRCKNAAFARCCSR